MSIAPTETPALPDDDNAVEVVQPTVIHEPQAIMKAILEAYQPGFAQSESIMGNRHLRISRWRTMAAGKFSLDITTDSPDVNSIYINRLGQLIEFGMSAILQQLLPDPQELGFVGMTAKWTGVDDDAKYSEALLRQKMRSVRPEGAPNLYELCERLVRDALICGDGLAIVGLDTREDDLDGDPSSCGPKPHYIDPLCWYPGSMRAATADECEHYLKLPLSEDDAERIPYLNSEALREAVEPGPLHVTDRYGEYGIFDDDSYGDGPSDFGWERIVNFGPLKWRAIARNLNEESWTREDVVAALGTVFSDLDPERLNQHWWSCEWVGDYLITLRPCPLDLPAGRGPLVHVKFMQRDGRLLGLGCYEAGGEILERLYNQYERDIVMIADYAADPPKTINPDVIDEEWQQAHEGLAGESFIYPGELIKIRRGMGQLAQQAPPISVLDLGVSQILLDLQSQKDRLDDLMRALVQASSDYTGQSRARTATVGQNNLNQSRTVEGQRIKKSECGWLWNLFANSYVVMRQAVQAQARKYQKMIEVPVGYDEQQLQKAVIDPEQIRSLSHIELSVNGSMAPANRQAQGQLMIQILQMILTAPPETMLQLQADPKWFLKTAVETIGIRGAHLGFKPADDVMAQAINAQAFWGPQGISMLPPEVQQQILAMTQVPGQSASGADQGAAFNQPGVSTVANPIPKAGFAMAGAPPMIQAPLEEQPGLTGMT